MVSGVEVGCADRSGGGECRKASAQCQKVNLNLSERRVGLCGTSKLAL
jgi:hypothetical protein